jgi:hypothetical protein
MPNNDDGSLVTKLFAAVGAIATDADMRDASWQKERGHSYTASGFRRMLANGTLVPTYPPGRYILHPLMAERANLKLGGGM